MKKLYAVYDLVAAEIVGPIFTHSADQAAIRDFSDVAKDARTTIGQHPADYQLVSLGQLEGLNIKPQHELIISGSQWLALKERDTAAEGGATGVPISLSDKERHARMTK